MPIEPWSAQDQTRRSCAMGFVGIVQGDGPPRGYAFARASHEFGISINDSDVTVTMWLLERDDFTFNRRLSVSL